MGRKWDYELLKVLAWASGKNPNGLRRTIDELASALNINLKGGKKHEKKG